MKCIGPKRRGQSRGEAERCLSDVPALLVALSPGGKSSAPMEEVSVCLPFFPLCVFFSALAMTPHSRFGPNSPGFAAEERCRLLSLMTQQQTEIPLGQLGLAQNMQVGCGREPGRSWS